MMRQPYGRSLLACAAAVVVTCAIAWSQMRVNTQVNNRVGGELYGNMGSVKYQSYQTNLLPSEARYQTWKSGALPSEVRMNARGVGPLAPTGSVAYIPGPSPIQQGMKLTPQPAASPYQVNAGIDPGMVAAPGYGSIHYATPQFKNASTIQQPFPPQPSVAGGPGPAPVRPAYNPTPGVALQPGAATGSQVGTVATGAPQVVGPATPGEKLFAQSTLQVGSVKYGQ